MLYLVRIPAKTRQFGQNDDVLPERFELSISRLLSERLSQLGHGSAYLIDVRQ